MKRILLVLLSSFLLVALCGCENAQEPEPGNTSGVVSGESSSFPDDNSIVTTEPVEVEHKPVTFTEADKEAMISELRGCVYSSFAQEMENGFEGKATYSTTRYSLSVNVEQNIHSISMRYITVDGVNRDGLGYKMYSDGENYIVSEDGEWVEADSEYEILAWDLSQFTNAWDLVSYLMHDVEFPVGVEGVSTGDYWEFEYSEQADDSLLSGIEYDTLLNADYKFTFRVRDNVPTPDSIVIKVGYESGEDTYYVESTLQFYSFGNTQISMPKVGTKD